MEIFIEEQVHFIWSLFAAEGMPKPGELQNYMSRPLKTVVFLTFVQHTGDVFRLSDTVCSCGSRFPVVHNEGRLRNAVLDGQAVLSPKGLDDREEILSGWIYNNLFMHENDIYFTFIVNDQYEKNAEQYIRDERKDFRYAYEHPCRKSGLHTYRTLGKFLCCISKYGENLIQEVIIYEHPNRIHKC